MIDNSTFRFLYSFKLSWDVLSLFPGYDFVAIFTLRSPPKLLFDLKIAKIIYKLNNSNFFRQKTHHLTRDAHSWKYYIVNINSSIYNSQFLTHTGFIFGLSQHLWTSDIYLATIQLHLKNNDILLNGYPGGDFSVATLPLVVIDILGVRTDSVIRWLLFYEQINSVLVLRASISSVGRQLKTQIS